MLNKYGQLFFSGLQDITLDKSEADFLKNENIGGVVLGPNNFQDPAQLGELVNSIQKLRDEYPLFIALNFENDQIAGPKKFFTQFPPIFQVAKLKSPKLVFELHQVIAKELSSCGINLCFSPSCNLFEKVQNTVFESHSYGSDPEEVEKFISAAIRGLQTNKVLACAEHFPGLGSLSKEVSDKILIDKTSLDDIRCHYLIPFVKASKSRVEFIKMGHVQLDSLDEIVPTSLSHKAYKFLREELKYTKIIITDFLDLKGMLDRFSLEESVVRAIKAGADIVSFTSVEHAKMGLNILNKSIKLKQIEKDEVDEKLYRVEKCKKNYFQSYGPVYIPHISSSLHTSESKKVVDKIASLIEKPN